VRIALTGEPYAIDGSSITASGPWCHLPRWPVCLPARYRPAQWRVRCAEPALHADL
jgi:hypothetical protein